MAVTKLKAAERSSNITGIKNTAVVYTVITWCVKS